MILFFHLLIYFVLQWIETSTSKDDFQKVPPEKPSVERTASSTTSLKVKYVATAASSIKARQTKIAANYSIDGVQLTGRQMKQESTLNEMNTTRKLPVPQDRPLVTNTAVLNADFPPLLHNPPSETLNRPVQANIPSNVLPPTSGISAPPGFFGAPQQELLLPIHQSSATIQPLPDNESEIEIMPSQPLLLSAVGSSGDEMPLVSSLFRPSPDNSFSRASIENIAPLSVDNSTPLSALSFRSQRFGIESLIVSNSSNDEDTDVQALFGAGSNFNVSNFLDGILGDSTSTQITTPLFTSEVETKPIESSSTADNTSFQANSISVPLDPWNHSDQEPQTTMIAGIPLKSNVLPLLSENYTNVIFAEPAYACFVADDDGAGDSDDFLEPDSFYNNLLGEDF